MAKERQIDLPRGQLFSASSPRRASTKRGKAAKQVKQEPAKPRLGPPRLIKSAKAAKQAADAEAIEAEAAEAAEAAATTAAPEATKPPVEETPAAPVPVAKAPPRSAPRLRSLRIENEPPKPQPAPELVEVPAQPDTPEAVEGAAPSAGVEESSPEPPPKTEDKPPMAAATQQAAPAICASAMRQRNLRQRNLRPRRRRRQVRRGLRFPSGPVDSSRRRCASESRSQGLDRRDRRLPERPPCRRERRQDDRPWADRDRCLGSRSDLHRRGHCPRDRRLVIVRRHDHIALQERGQVAGPSSRCRSSQRPHRQLPERSRLPRA